MLTEAEAKTKWCPFARYSFGDDPASNRWKQSLPVDEPYALNPVPCRCIASACAAWRKAETVEFKARADMAYKLRGDRLTSDTGFCGLAGKPEGA